MRISALDLGKRLSFACLSLFRIRGSDSLLRDEIAPAATLFVHCDDYVLEMEQSKNRIIVKLVSLASLTLGNPISPLLSCLNGIVLVYCQLRGL